MLETLRRGASSKIAAIVIFLPLIGAFALWGIGPEIRGGGRPWLARVGDTTIYPEEFDRSFRNELQQLSRQAGRPITADQARMFGIDQRVLSRLAGATALDQQADALGLALPVQAVADEVRADPNFQEVGGRFSKQRFDAIMRENGMTETNYLATRRRDDMREQLTDVVVAGFTPSQAYVDMMNAYRNETRVIAFTTVDPALAVKVGEPDDAKLKAFYDAHKAEFASPESRKIGVLLLTRSAVTAKIAVSDEEIKAAYEADTARYDIPETRHIYQMAFKDRAAAEAAQPVLAKAKDFAEAAAKLGAVASDVDLGVLSKVKMIDPKIADAVFALKQNEVSKAIEGTFATVVAKVTQITPGQKKTLADVATQVKERLQESRSTQEMQAISSQVEDERSAGKPLAEVAQKLGLDYKEIVDIRASGLGADGKPVLASAADAKAVAQGAFQGAIGLDPDPVDLEDGGEAWVTVLAVSPAKDRPLEDVKADVTSVWKAAETQIALSDLAAKLVDRLKAGETIEAVAKDGGGKVETTGAITRNTSPPGLTSNAVTQAFALPKDGAGSSATADGKSRTVFRVDAINPAPAPSAQQSDQLRKELQQEMQADALNTYVDGLERRLGLKVNDAALSQLLGGNRQGQ